MRNFNIDKMKIACRAAARTLQLVGRSVRPGITTDALDRIVHNDTVRQGAYPAPLNYKGFPRSCCTSVNDVVCHGIPGALVLKAGDIVNIDVTSIVDGHFGDTSATFFVGDVGPEIRHLVVVTEQALHDAIEHVRPGTPLNHIGQLIQGIADNHGYGVVKEFGGHGVGVRFHTPPHVNHFDTGDNSIIMHEGMIFTIEPMLCLASPQVKMDDDGWTIRTIDGSWSAQFEHTLLVTAAGCEVLTLP